MFVLSGGSAVGRWTCDLPSPGTFKFSDAKNLSKILKGTPNKSEIG